MAQNTLFNWPTDKDGNPMSLISISVKDLIPTAKFANVELGPATITKFVPEDSEEEGLHNAYQTADSVVQKYHDEILKEIEGENK